MFCLGRNGALSPRCSPRVAFAPLHELLWKITRVSLQFGEGTGSASSVTASSLWEPEFTNVS